MVHALEEIQRLLTPDGILIDIHPVPEGSVIEVLHAGKTLFAERKRLTCSEDVLHAESALERCIEGDLFAVDQQAEFDFLTYASTVSELRAFWDEQNAFDDRARDEAVVKREEDLYSQAEKIMQTAGAGAEVAMYERARIARLRPLG